jgi:ubiquinone/menaquinone biosynthesis C-methylase UbiE
MNEKSFEYRLEHNRLRSFVRETMEVKRLRKATDIGAVERALHIACGNGDATCLIRKYFPVGRIEAVDRDADLIARARQAHGDDSIGFSVQDACDLAFPDSAFDEVFDLADLHNTSEWRRGVLELHRVLKPGGLLVLEEISRETFGYAAGRVFKALTEHPYDAMLTIEEFLDCVRANDFEILRFERKNPFGLFKYFLLIARKT